MSGCFARVQDDRAAEEGCSQARSLFDVADPVIEEAEPVDRAQLNLQV
jgi:hypothetical protein